jgi:Common central domain of tyrosinase
MALRTIIGITRGSRGNINAVCVRDLHEPIPVPQVIQDITKALHRYLVRRGGFPAWVGPVRGRGDLWVYSEFGPEVTLDFLPVCQTQSRIQPTPPVRRDIATVGNAERARLRDAIIELNRRRLTPDDSVSVWFKQDEIHQATHVHSQASFLPWHRVLVNDFERQLQEIDPTLALHYWDWTTDPRRAPDGQGGTVNLMDAGFLGASTGPVGSPLLEAGFYRPTPPNRVLDEQGRARPVQWQHLPPADLSRLLPSSGRGPREVTMADVDELYANVPQADRPRSEDQIRIKSDQDIVSAGFSRPGVAFERFWRELYIAHGLAHRYIGGNVGGFGGTSDAAHRSFEDPFVFLLHSNVDRLWASWQLSQEGFERWVEPAWRLEPAWAYGQLVDDLVEVATGVDRFPGESDADYDARYEAARKLQGSQAGREIKSTMAPWNGRGTPSIVPWHEPVTTRDIRPLDREVLRPPLYDRYVFDGNLCAAWATLQLGRRLSTHDVVRLTVEVDATSRDGVEFVLGTGPEVSWWKALRLPNGTMIETDGALAQASAGHPAAELPGGQLIFHKLQGVVFPGRRIVFRVVDLEWIRPGSRLTFLWEDD